MAIQYRPEIDGMRTIAVVSVIIYHLRMPSPQDYVLKGGFLGVDMFFVLSGFLITSIIAKEIEAKGSMSFGDFYLRRARRILPPLFLVIFATLPVAYFTLLPSEVDAFAGSIWASLGFYSNIFWFIELNEYGSQSGLLQPFLHTWSLAIEEQFYIVWPIILILAMKMKRKWLMPLGLVLLIGSFAVAQVSTDWRPHFSFFSTASRAWELLAGALLGLSVVDWRALAERHIWLRFAPSLGFIMIAASMVFVDLDAGSHPGFVTIPTILGTCLMIAFANPGDVTTRALATKPMVFIGKLSYSIYLWHFPIFAFARLHSVENPGPLDWAIWTALTFIFSYAGYKLIEKPLRFKVPTKPFLVGLATSALAIIALPLGLKSLDMNEAPRAKALAEVYGDNDFDNGRLKEVHWEVIDGVPGGVPGETDAHRPSPNEQNNVWFDETDRTKVLVIGNSHSIDLFNALYLNTDKFDGVQFARFGMEGILRADQVELLRQAPNYKAADVIAVASFWFPGVPTYEPAIRSFLADGKEVVLINNTARYPNNTRLPFIDHLAQSRGEMPQVDEANRLAYEAQDREVAEDNRWIAQLGEKLSVPVYDRYGLVCSRSDKLCSQLTPNGKKTVYDYGHWTNDGARLFGERAAEAGWFSEFAGR